jgi:hypothetical protein
LKLANNRLNWVCHFESSGDILYKKLLVSKRLAVKDLFVGNHLCTIWVWMIFNETPTTMTLFGGGVMLSAIITHSLWELRQARRSEPAKFQIIQPVQAMKA